MNPGRAGLHNRHPHGEHAFLRTRMTRFSSAAQRPYEWKELVCVWSSSDGGCRGGRCMGFGLQGFGSNLSRGLVPLVVHNRHPHGEHVGPREKLDDLPLARVEGDPPHPHEVLPTRCPAPAPSTAALVHALVTPVAPTTPAVPASSTAVGVPPCRGTVRVRRCGGLRGMEVWGLGCRGGGGARCSQGTLDQLRSRHFLLGVDWG